MHAPPSEERGARLARSLGKLLKQESGIGNAPPLQHTSRAAEVEELVVFVAEAGRCLPRWR